MKAHIGVDADTGLVRTATCTPASVAGVTQVDTLLHGKEKTVHGDTNYTGAAKRREHNRRTVTWHIAERRSTTKKRPDGRLKQLTEELETLKVRFRARVEHPFRMLKRQFGYTSVRYRGMAKNTTQVLTLFALLKLRMMRRRFLATAREVRL